MTKVELVNAIAEKTAQPKKTVAAIVDAFIDVVPEAVASGENVALVGFGTFTKVERAAREGKNPQTKEKITIPAKVVPKFKPGKAFKEAVL